MTLLNWLLNNYLKTSQKVNLHDIILSSSLKTLKCNSTKSFVAYHGVLVLSLLIIYMGLLKT